MRVRLIVLCSIAWVCAAQTATISGIVTDALTHLPLQGAAITANGAIMRTDIEGRYSLNVAPSAAVPIAASRTGYFAPAPAAPASIAAGENLQRNFELRPLLKITGVVEDYDTGERIKGVHVFALQRIYALGRAWHIPAGLITADTRSGTFEIRNLEPGNYVLEFVPEDETTVSTGHMQTAPSTKFHGRGYYPNVERLEMAAPISVTVGDVPVTVRLRKPETHSISGSVTRAAFLQLVRYDATGPRAVCTFTFPYADSFHIDDLPGGEYRLVALTTDGMGADIPLSLGNRDITDIRVKPGPGGIVAGTVRMEDSSLPLPSGLGFGIALFHAGILRLQDDRQAPVTNGRFQIPVEIDEFEARLTGVPQGYAAVSDAAAPWDYTIRKVGQLSGTMQGDADYVLLPGGTTLAGTFAIDLAPGKYQIARLEGDERKLARDPEFLKAKSAEALKTVEIRAGEITTLAP